MDHGQQTLTLQMSVLHSLVHLQTRSWNPWNGICHQYGWQSRFSHLWSRTDPQHCWGLQLFQSTTDSRHVQPVPNGSAQKQIEEILSKSELFSWGVVKAPMLRYEASNVYCWIIYIPRRLCVGSTLMDFLTPNWTPYRNQWRMPFYQRWDIAWRPITNMWYLALENILVSAHQET